VKGKLISAAAVAAACLALTAGATGTATAQVVDRVPTTAATAKSCENFWYISGNGVRIRKSPGGTALGAANSWERVTPGSVSGSWTYVTFYNRAPGTLRAGWVSSQFVSYYQPTCW
jgi:hypothetical protein